MIINLKSSSLEYHASLWSNGNKVHGLRTQDPDFNRGCGERFYRAFDRAIHRGDFNV